jgi:predicted ATPase
VREPEHVLPAVSRVLVLDNFEQVAPAAGEVSALLAAAREVKALVTSREPLHVAGERVLAVDPLPPSDAVQLFVERADGVEADETVEEICRWLDGLPLAIELAAARTRALDPPELLRRLELAVLTGGPRDAPARQQTLRATIEWSYALLSEEERRLFDGLSVFVGGFTIEAAESVSDAGLDGLSSLVEKSLLRRTGDRYTMLEVVREFARERLADDIRLRHVAWTADLAEAARPHLRTGSQDVWFERLFAEEANLRAALACAIELEAVDLGLRLVTALETFWHRMERSPEGVVWGERVLALPGGDPLLRARAQGGTGHMAVDADDYDLAERLLAEAVPLLRERGDMLGLATALRGLGDLHWRSGERDGARASFSEAAELFEQLGDFGAVAGRLNELAYLAMEDGDAEGALELAGRAVDAAGGGGDRLNVSGVIHTFGDLALLADDELSAAQNYRRALRQSLEIGYGRVVVAASLAGLAAAHAARREPAEAGRCWALFERFEDRESFHMGRVTSVDYRARITALGPVERAVFDAARAAAQDEPLDEAIAEVGSGA